jgi:hypothetical protein
MSREFGRRLHHDTPLWVPHDAIFHIRIRCASDNPAPLTERALGSRLMESVGFYRDRQLWWPRLWLLMPDHIHALVSFPPDKAMHRVVGNWKEYHARHNGVRWQENFFDHRIRNEQEMSEKFGYIVNNPVAKGLCAEVEDWPWVLIAGSQP